MRYALPILTAACGLVGLFLSPNPSIAVSAALLPGSAVLGYLFDENENAKSAEKADRDKNSED